MNTKFNITSEEEAIKMINIAFAYLCKNKTNEYNIGLESSCDMKFKNNGDYGIGFTTARIVPANKSSNGSIWETDLNVKYVLQCGNANLAKRRRTKSYYY